ncbi:hypothetical protein F2Q69_00020694 [Brassica cretica]|uniref:Uncharacterized protein n=1 Tax=Brassica cretica TaxID=69181 RepID=A0A8S9QFY3_BRACR|nr:hypothetical protein F2Q69_00020694 [Brassica cretica]
MHVIEPLVVMIGCYMLILVESVSRWFSSTAPDLSRGGSPLIEREVSSTATELSSMAMKLSSMAMKLSLGGDKALSQWLSTNRRIHGARERNLKAEECKAGQYRELSSTVPDLSSTATELSSMAMKLSLGGDGALSKWLSSNRRIHGARGRNLKAEECKAEQYRCNG